jgi:flagellar biosynthetic protein FliR
MTHSVASALPGVPGIQDFTVAQIELWLLVLVRVSMMVFLLPIINSDEIPTRLKAGLSFFLSLIIFPSLPQAALEIPSSLAAYFILAMRELYIGAVMGFAATFIFVGLRFAGSWIDQESGFSMMQIFNPMMQEEDTPLAHFMFILFILLLLSTGGYVFYIRAISESFQILPLGWAHFASADMIRVFVQMSTDAFVLGLKVAAPVVTTLFISSVALAIIARIMPQMNVWLVGMPMKLALGILTLFFALPMMWQTFLRGQDRLQAFYVALMHLMRA